MSKPSDGEGVQELVDMLRLDSGDYGSKMIGHLISGSWDQREVRAWEAAEQITALLAEIQALRE